MLTIEQVRSRLRKKSNLWLYVLVTSLQSLCSIALIATGATLIYFIHSTKKDLVVDLILLKPFLHRHVIFLIVLCALLILLGSHGLLTQCTNSYISAIANAAFLVMLLCSSNSYILKLPEINVNSTDIHNVLIEKMKDPIEIVMIDKLQRKYSCCGIHNYTDWLDVAFYIPGSCCQNELICDVDDPNLYTVGCSDIIKSKVYNFKEMFINSLIGVNVIEMITIFLAFWTYTFFRDIRETVTRKTVTSIPSSQVRESPTTTQVSPFQSNIYIS